MKIGVVSDTHGNVANTLRAVDLLGQRKVEAVLHCGDIVSSSIIPLFAEWPTHFVFGNCDGDADLLRSTIKDCGQTCHERFGEIELADRRIAVLHGDDGRQFQRTVTGGHYDLVCYGHTHQFEQHREGNTLVLNPGALHRANPHTFAVVDLTTLDVDFVLLNSP